MKKTIISIVTFILVIVLSILFIGRTFYPDNVAETSIDGGTKELKTRIYKTDLATARKAVTEVVGNLSTYGSNWKIVNDKTQTENIITVEVPVIVFTDDLTVKFKETENNGELQIDVVSKSRVGKSDFGENARHVRKFLSALDEKLVKN